MEEFVLGSIGRKLAGIGVWKAGPWRRSASGDLNLRAETTSCSPLTCYPGHCFLFSRVVGGRRKTPGFWLLSRPVTFGSGATG